MDWAHWMEMGSVCLCRKTIVMTSKVEPCHVEPCRPATGSCNVFSAQLAANVDLSVLVLYGLISAARRQCAQHYSGRVVAETLNIHWYHTEGCCNNPSGMSLPNLSLLPSWVFQGTFEFYRSNIANSKYFGKNYYIVIYSTGWIKQDTKIPGWFHIWCNGWITIIDDNVFLASGSFTGGNNDKFGLVII